MEKIIIETTITKRSYGTERKDKLLAISDPISMSPEFKDALYDDYGIDLETLEEEAGDNTTELRILTDAQGRVLKSHEPRFEKRGMNATKGRIGQN